MSTIGSDTTRAVVLLQRPRGDGPAPTDFAVRDIPLAAPVAGQLLVRNIVMSVDPSMRGRLDVGEKHYTTNFEIGEPLDGSVIGEVVAAPGGEFAPGTLVRHRMGWRDHAVVDAAGVSVVDESLAPIGTWLGILGQTGFTAWVGLKRTAEFRDGDAVFISAAAGAVGSAAGAFAKLFGASRVVGSAGGAAKVAMLVDELGYDDAFDYRAETPFDGLRRVAPDGIDVYFDNVGGPHLVAALRSMHINGRVALCGMISQFSADGRGQDINNMIEAVLRRITVRGFIVRDHEDMRPEFETTVAGWLRDGTVQNRQTVTDGLENAVDGFLDMLKGGNIGKALVRIDTTRDI